MEEPETIRELFFYLQGEFKEVRQEVKAQRRFVYWFSSTISGIVASIAFCLIRIFNK